MEHRYHPLHCSKSIEEEVAESIKETEDGKEFCERRLQDMPVEVRASVVTGTRPIQDWVHQHSIMDREEAH